MEKEKAFHHREDFGKRKLLETSAAKVPMQQFDVWFNEALEKQVMQVNAATIASVSADGWPSCRIILMRSYNEEGLIFYTNYNSSKGQEIMNTPKGCLNFFWPELERQVRFQGSITTISSKQSDAYFASRPRESQIGAWASKQSHVLKNREELDECVHQYNEAFKGKEIPRPKHWGGFQVTPHMAEFWQGRPSRLHDRLRYLKQKNGTWLCERLFP